MAQRSFKLSDELDERLVAAAVRDDRAVSYVIVKALEQALGAGSRNTGGSPGSAQLPSRPSPAEVPQKISAPVRRVGGADATPVSRAEAAPAVGRGVTPVLRCAVCGRSSASFQWGCPEHGYGKVHPVRANGEWR